MEQEKAPLTPDPSDTELHARKCTVCNHPQCDEIEEEFVYWGHPGSIVKRFGLSHRSVLYRHARALRLYEVRAIKLRSALEHIIERAAVTKVTSDSIVRAVQAYAHIDARGKWEEPIRKVMAVTEIEQAKEIVFEVSQPIYDLVQMHKAESKRYAQEDAQRSIANLQALVKTHTEQQEQNGHP